MFHSVRLRLRDKMPWIQSHTKYEIYCIQIFLIYSIYNHFTIELISNVPHFTKDVLVERF